MPSSFAQKDLFADAGLGNALVVSVVEAKNLIALDMAGDSDPFVALEYGKAKKKSEVINNNLNPRFGFTAVFPFGSKGHPLTLTIKDWNKIGKNKPLGSVSIDVERLSEGDSSEKWYQLEGVPTGQVHVHLFRTKRLEDEEEEGLASEMLDQLQSLSKKRKSSIFSFPFKGPRKVSMVN